MQFWKDLTGGVGILGGTFDPIHLGHVQIATAVKEKYGLSVVSIIPAFLNPLREHEQVLADTKERLIMAHFATLETDWMFVDPIEIDRGRHQPGLSYTIDTLHAYRMRFPNVPITLIVGADNVAFHNWKDIDEYPELLARIVAVARPDYEKTFKENISKVRAFHPAVADMVEFLADIKSPFSSTKVRESLRTGKVPSELLHPSVAQHVQKYGLYGCKEACGA
jgi:nicotinate-nucleotide adenylyltransferase